MHLLFIARGAAYEVEAQLIACADLELIDRIHLNHFIRKL
ncbi:MAG: hypothetical protein ACM67S_00435 [Bacteroidota bacterium]